MKRQKYLYFIGLCLIIILISTGIVSGKTEEPNAILISWDGVSKDPLLELMDSGKLQNLTGIYKNGSFVNLSITDHFPDTMSGHAQMLTGYPPEITGVFKSMRYKEIPSGLTLFERLEDNLGDETIFTGIIASQEKSLGSLHGLPFYHAGKIVDYHYDKNSDAGLVGSVATEAVHHFANQGRFFIFIHFRDAADSGYAFGAGTQKQLDQIINVDAGTGMILNAVRDAGVAENTMIFITTDHGFNSGQTDNAGQNDLWLITNEPGLNETGDQKDIVPTVLQKMGVPFENITPVYPGISLI